MPMTSMASASWIVCQQLPWSRLKKTLSVGSSLWWGAIIRMPPCRYQQREMNVTKHSQDSSTAASSKALGMSADYQVGMLCSWSMAVLGWTSAAEHSTPAMTPSPRM